MPIEYKKNKASFLEVVGVEEAESLLEWLLEKPSAKVDFFACTHVHPANLQVLMAGKTKIAAWPEDKNLAALLKTLLQYDKQE
jgi:hypothetical protein